MRSVDEQLARVLATGVRPSPVRVAISEAQGLLCAEEVVAEQALPGFDQAAVDGYAVRSVDVQHADEEAATLPVVGEIPAGSRQPRRLQPGQAVHVVTDAPLPTLADAVVPLEYTDQHPAKVTVRRSVPSAAFVRRTGEDVRTGDVVVRRGTFIAAAQVGLLAAVGRTKVLVHPRPRISLISVGDELVDTDRSPGQGQVYDVNSYALSAAAREAGAEVTRVGVVGSDSRRLREVIEGRLLLSEIVVITGAAGGSAGAELRSSLSDLGDLDVTRVAMHPGSVQGFGKLGPDKVPTFLLPGNPVSALIVFEVLVRPLIRSALGKTSPHRRSIPAELVSPVESASGRRGFLRGRLLRDSDSGSYLVDPVTSAGALASLSEANCLVVVDENVTEAAAGTAVRVSFLSQRV
ncbi:molybdopterin molybdotransferase [Saccharopolyspora lacisalsi]|uniref:Molybdopterin molybdenumtransferase n=1 Tax=Halosaccharopolyspora lacisalsi TaxID=1000566 RepID=A0A839DXZ0_9PSEU|nr:gephyrin-like molybdotransferase Glp [Halosaccharopolyspora lacisalsi]MBA8826832.1 molybdopterin molybdotransferase [Halosaccharopolyspora lacisalsi]